LRTPYGVISEIGSASRAEDVSPRTIGVSETISCPPAKKARTRTHQRTLTMTPSYDSGLGGSEKENGFAQIEPPRRSSSN
jgi:hypothetical protein